MNLISDCGKYRINKTGTTPPIYMAVRCVPPPSEILKVGGLDDCKLACAAGSKRK